MNKPTQFNSAYQQAQYIGPLQEEIAAQALAADQSRSVDGNVIEQIKSSNVMRISASSELGGLDESICVIADELSATAAACTSTAWCLWNHLCTFHFFCGLLGPSNQEFLKNITEQHEWVCFPAGASSQVAGDVNGDSLVLNGVAAFGSGARYAEWAGVIYNAGDDDAPDHKFTMVDLRQSAVRIEPTWEAMSVRASATDHIYYENATESAARSVPFPETSREVMRDPEYPVIHPRYREDWVALSVVWLGAMAVGVANSSLEETANNIRDRYAIFGTKMAERPTIHVNLGRARGLINAARDTVYAACQETDARIANRQSPSEIDYCRQTSAGTQAVLLCDEAMRLILRVLGGNGLRENTDFERRYRDFQAMPLHINGHQDRITELTGRHLLGLENNSPI
ncbi:MAG: acyl-CoA dehydrogenase family protein [Pseudomonadota bacterium]